MANTNIGSFCSIFMPQADYIVSDRSRSYFYQTPAREGQRLLAALAGTNQAAKDQAQTAFRTISDTISNASRIRATQWVDNVLNTFGAYLAANRVVLGGPGYANDILYIISVPEFGLNAFKKDATMTWDATGIFPQSLENYIQDQVRDRLWNNFRHVHVLFIFSCCTHTSDVTASRIIASNRLSVIWTPSEAPSPLDIVRTVTKFRWDVTDNNPKPEMFTPDKAWDPKTGNSVLSLGSPARDRFTETEITLP